MEQITEFVELITCKETGKIYLDPVMTPTGIITELDTCINNNEKYYFVKPLKSLIDNFIENYPEYGKSRYISTQTVYKIFITKQYDKLLNFDNFNMNLFRSEKQCISFIEQSPNNIIKHFISHCENLNYAPNTWSWYFINILCNRHSGENPNIVLYAIDCKFDLNSICKSDGWTAVHQIIYFANDTNLLKKIIDKHAIVDFYKKNENGSTPLDFIFKYKPFEIIEYAVKKLNVRDLTIFDLSRLTSEQKNSLIKNIEI